jgi:predicted ribosome quality control (RQC) complex YloA/Tae2 family protein
MQKRAFFAKKVLQSVRGYAILHSPAGQGNARQCTLTSKALYQRKEVFTMGKMRIDSLDLFAFQQELKKKLLEVENMRNDAEDEWGRISDEQEALSDEEYYANEKELDKQYNEARERFVTLRDAVDSIEEAIEYISKAETQVSYLEAEKII